MMKFSRLVFLATLGLVLISTVAFAGSAAQPYLEAKQRELTEIIRQPKSAANDQKLTTTFDALLDYDAFAKNSLEGEWDKLSAEDRTKFQKLLTVLVQRSYTKNIRDTLDYNIVFKGGEPAKVGELVRTVAQHKTDKRKEQLKIDYLVHQVSGKWRVFDIITEGESLVGNYKSQFRRIVAKEGFAGLLKRMQDKVDSGT